MSESIIVRPAHGDDIAAITAIYRNEVITGSATFELEPPDETGMRRRFHAIAEAGFPWLAACRENVVRGYAYASAFRPRPAYRWSVEDTVYVASDARGQGVGKLLLSHLITACEDAGFHQMLAVVGGTNKEPSIRLHQSLGFEHTGILKAVGWKHGQWHDVVLMQRALNQ